MSRYIDIETIKPRQYENSEVELGVLAYDYDEVDAMPFLDIVRCKECKWAEVEGRTTHYLVCQRHPYSARAVDLTDFCSEGKRKESE